MYNTPMIEKLADKYGTTIKALKRRNSSQEIKDLRGKIVVKLHDNFECTFYQIGKWLNRDVTTIKWYYNRYKNER